MDITSSTQDRHSENQPELGSDSEPSERPVEARLGADPPESPSPVRPKRKYTRRAKPQPQKPAPAPGHNGQLLEAASIVEAAPSKADDEWDLDSLRVSQD